MTKEKIIRHLPQDHPWKDQLQYLEVCTSTNDLLKQLARQGAPHGTVLIADRQTGGHGRMGRSFLSPGGVGIYMRLLRPDCLPGQLMHLTCATAVAVCDAVEAAVGFRPGIKWTNDLVYQKRKLCGILTELGLRPDGRTDYAIIGVGINCCQQEQDFAPEIRHIAGSLSMVTGTTVSRSAVAAAMLDALQKMDASLLSGTEACMAQYRKDCITIGKEISLVRGEEIRHGTAVDVDKDGALVVRFPDGNLHRITSGEVSVRGMYGYV